MIQQFRLFGSGKLVSISLSTGFRVWKLSTSLETLLKKGFSLNSVSKCLRGDWNSEGGLALLVPLAELASFSLCKQGIGRIGSPYIILDQFSFLLSILCHLWKSRYRNSIPPFYTEILFCLYYSNILRGCLFSGLIQLMRCGWLILPFI